MNKLLLVGLCIAGATTSTYLDSRRNLKNALRELPDVVAEASEGWDEDCTMGHSTYISMMIGWWTFAMHAKVHWPAHQKDLNTAIETAIAKQVKG